MRIRKRWPLTSHLPPLTAATPDPPAFTAPSVHQNQPQDDEEKKGILSTRERRGGGGLPLHPNGDLQRLHDRRSNGLDRPTSNLHPMLLMRKRNGWIRTDGGMPPHPTINMEASKGKGGGGEEDNDEKWVDGEKCCSSSNMRNVNSSSVEAAARMMFPPFSSSHQGERVFSFKKKRGGRGEEAMAAKEKKMTQKLDEEDDVYDGVDDGDFKKRGRGNSSASDAVVEGSRCSRVNGRGWRCSQQTLVGYALCEHHLGKGRLKSMSSVRSRAPAISTPKNNVVGENSNDDSILSLSCQLQEEALVEEEEEEEDEKPTTMAIMKKKRKKIGTVKARSINSLLDQTHHTTSTVEEQ